MLSVKSILKPLQFFVKSLPKWFLTIILGILFIFSIQYFKIEIFYKEKNIPFSGDYFYNPYNDFSQNTLKANFHTHSKENKRKDQNVHSARNVYDHYKNQGYDIISLSNYQMISTDTTTNNYIPVYEHGYNIFKSHQLVLNSTKVTYFDFSLLQNYDTQQQVINKLRLKGGLIALAHPGLFGAYNEKTMKYLKGYDFIEVLNNYNVSESVWDAALTSGYPAWILADDDCHDISRPNLSFNNWTRIGAKGQSNEEIILSLKKGCHYGVRNLNHTEENYLDSCIVAENEISVYFQTKADKITFVSDNGLIRKEFINVASAVYNISQQDSYVRIEAQNGDQLIYLNPIIRYNGYQLTYNNGFALINTTATFLFRILVILYSVSILVLILLMNGIKVRPERTFSSIVKSKPWELRT